MLRRNVGSTETWHTRARYEWRDAAGAVGCRVWLCHKCGYWPSSDSTLPADKCGNCGEQWKTTADDSLATPVTVKVTDYGYEREQIGKTPNAVLTGAARNE